jgi:carbon storage regulator
MLVLTRKEGESIKIGNDITIKVYKIGINQVKVAIDAPKHLDIVREELIKRTIVENVPFEKLKPVNKTFAPD